jgi:hypothetical protein
MDSTVWPKTVTVADGPRARQIQSQLSKRTTGTCGPINQPSSASPRRLLTFVVWSAGLENQRLAGISDAQEITALTCLTALTA